MIEALVVLAMLHTPPVFGRLPAGPLWYESGGDDGGEDGGDSEDSGDSGDSGGDDGEE